MGEYTGRSVRVEVTSILRGPAFGLPLGHVIMSIKPCGWDPLVEPEHCLKTWPEHYLEVVQGTKRFELRRDDHGFEDEDVLQLEEYIPSDEERVQQTREKRTEESDGS